MTFRFFSILAGLFTALTLTAPAEPAGDPLTVLSYNIRYGTAKDGANRWALRRDVLFDAIRKSDADVIGVQEALAFQLEELRAACPGYRAVGTGRDGGQQGEHCSVLYRTARFDLIDHGTFWLSETPDRVSISWNSACRRICTWARLEDRISGKKLAFFNTHLDHVSAEARVNGMKLIVSRIPSLAGDLPVVLTGDFNARPDQEPARLPARPPLRLVDAWKQAHPQAPEPSTSNGFRRDRPARCIDYIWVSPSWQVEEAVITPPPSAGPIPSDHNPVWARLRMP